MDQLKKILSAGAKKFEIDIDQEGAQEVSKRSRGTPRVGLRLLKRVIDFAQCEKQAVITSEIARNALAKLDVDQYGLDGNDYRYLEFIAEKYNGGPVGVETISAGLSEHRDSIEETIEPYLIQQGFLQRTSRGRVLTEFALSHLKASAN